jgi:DNA-binding SARP family transcriptional activator
VRFSLLGTVMAERDGAACDLGAPKQRALLARFLIDVGRPVSVDRLVEDLWGGSPPSRAMASLHAYVSNLRRVVEPNRPVRTPAAVLVTQPPGYALRVAPESVDAYRFANLVVDAGDAFDGGRAALAAELATEALGLWRGPALADIADEPFAAVEAAHLEDLRLVAEETRLAAALELGRHAEAVAELERLVAAQPLRERRWELLVLALYRAGRSADALDRYQRIRALLGDELGLDPGPRLRDLEAAVLRQDAALLPASGRVAAPASAAASTPVLQVSPAPAAPAPALPLLLDRAGRPPLVGREAELAVLVDLLDDVATGQTRWALLTAPAGMGKSRLAETVRQRARLDGWSVATARCHEDGGAPPHWVWRQILSGLPVTGRAAPEVTSREDPVAALPAEDRFTLAQGIERVLVETAASAPLMVVIDDLQWADVDSLRVLRYLAVQLQEAPVAVVATIRDDEETPPLLEVRAILDRQPGARTLPLGPLAPAAVGAIAHALTGTPADAALVARLHARSGGNPYFATELARLGGATPDQLPVGVREALVRRLQRLPADVRGLLVLGAVAGQVFDPGLLSGALGQPLVDVLDQLDPALATGLVTEEGTRLSFAHGLLRDALLAELTPAQRRRLHARLAATLAGRPDPGDRRLAELAHHLVEAGPAGDLDAAVDAAVRSSELSLARLAYDDAARWAARALGALDQRDAAGAADLLRRHDLLHALGRARYLAGRVPEARAALLEAVDVAVALSDQDAVARSIAALSATGGIWIWADLGTVPTEAIARLTAALDAVGTGPTAARARLLSVIATGLSYGDDRARVAAVSDEALVIARQLDDVAVLADVLLDRSFLRWGAGTCAEAVALTDEALALPGLGALTRVTAYSRRSVALLYLGRLDEATADHGRAVAVAEEARLVAALMQLAQQPIARAIAEGRLDDADAHIAAAWTLRERGDVPIVAEAIRLFEVMAERERHGMGPCVERLAELASALPLRSTLLMLALGHLERGDTDAATAALARAAAGLDMGWIRLFGDAVEAEVRAGLPPDAQGEALAARLGRYTDHVAAAGTTLWWGPVGLSLALLEVRLGRVEQAEVHLRDAVARAEAWGTATWAARARVHLEHLTARSAQR